MTLVACDQRRASIAFVVRTSCANLASSNGAPRPIRSCPINQRRDHVGAFGDIPRIGQVAVRMPDDIRFGAPDEIEKTLICGQDYPIRRGNAVCGRHRNSDLQGRKPFVGHNLIWRKTERSTNYDRDRLSAINLQRRRLLAMRGAGEVAEDAFYRLQEELDWPRSMPIPCWRFSCTRHDARFDPESVTHASSAIPNNGRWFIAAGEGFRGRLARRRTATKQEQ